MGKSPKQTIRKKESPPYRIEERWAFSRKGGPPSHARRFMRLGRGRALGAGKHLGRKNEKISTRKKKLSPKKKAACLCQKGPAGIFFRNISGLNGTKGRDWCQQPFGRRGGTPVQKKEKEKKGQLLKSEAAAQERGPSISNSMKNGRGRTASEHSADLGDMSQKRGSP